MKGKQQGILICRWYDSINLKTPSENTPIANKLFWQRGRMKN